MNLLRIVMVIFLQARGGIEQDVLEAYCWMYSTWNIPKEYKGACSGGDQVHEYSIVDYLTTKLSPAPLYKPLHMA